MKYHIIVFGCQMNVSDAERVSTVLESASGYEKTSNINEADLVVIVMCSVRQSAVDRVYGLIEKFKKSKNKPITVLTGCILKRDRKKLSEFFDYVVDIKEIRTLPKILKKQKTKSETDYFEITPKYAGKNSAFLPISNGCNNFCTYCVVPYTRGRLICRDHKKILKEAKGLINKGFKEIWLLGQNVNDYTSPSNNSIDFPELLKMVNNLPGNFKIFFMSPNPKNFSDKLIKTMAECKNFSLYLNLPVQAGDNEILRKMNRSYAAKKYIELVKKIRKAIPDINLSTDVIVGFPGETKKQFENTAKLFKRIKFNIAYINKYSPRYGTAASKLEDDVPWIEKKRREKVLMDIINEKYRYAKNKLIVILGPTASGKTDLSIKLAKKFNGEIVSADSRQVYKGMDIGTGKITKKEMQGIPHYLLDVANPKTRFTVAQYQKLAVKAIKNILSKNSVPFLVGGTGFYIQSVTDGIVIPEVKPDWKLRGKLEKKPAPGLYQMLLKLDPAIAKTIDKNNPRRLIRALEIILKLGTPIAPLTHRKPNFEALFIGIKKDKGELKKLIEKRLAKRLSAGMIEEIKKLKKSGLSWNRLEEFGLEYRFVAQYLQNKITYPEMIDKIQKESEHYAKRQMTWFKRDKRIHWIKNHKEAEELVEKFI